VRSQLAERFQSLGLQAPSADEIIESLKLEGDRITFKFHGQVSGMQTGEEGASRNLMPNLLEWLKARQPLSLVWGSSLFIYALIISTLRWYRSGT